MIALYPRVSTSEQAESGYSIEEQTERMKKYCESKGWAPYKVYTDAGYSGGNTNRPALQQMIRDIRAGKIERVVVYKLDRLSRSQLDTLNLIENEFLAHGCDFISISENFDTSSPFGRAMIGILAVFAQLEREQIKERMKMGKEARAKEGKFHGSAQVPIGYDYIDGNLVTNEFEKLQIVRIYEMYSQGIRPPKIAEILNSEGLTHKNGKWLPYTIRAILPRKTYLGYSYYNGEWYKGTHEAFISQELYDKVQRIRARHREEHIDKNRRPGRANSYLGGFLYCARCGAKYIKKIEYYYGKNYEPGSQYQKKYEKYSCNSRTQKSKLYNRDPSCRNKIWNMTELDEIIFSEIRKLAIDPSYLDEVSSTSDDSQNATAITSQIAEIESKISRLIDLYTEGEIPKNSLVERVHALEDQREKLQLELDRIQDTKKELMRRSEVESLASSFSDILDNGDLDEIREAVAALIDRINLDGDDIEIIWRF